MKKPIRAVSHRVHQPVHNPMKKVMAPLLMAALALAAGCAPVGRPAAPAPTPASIAEAARVAAPTLAPTPTPAVTPSPEATTAAFPGATSITLGESIAVEGQGARVEGGGVRITAGGRYVLSGALADGQVAVDAQGQKVTLALNGVEIACSTSAPLYIANADHVEIVLLDGTTNRLSDGAAYIYPSADEDEPNAALFSKDDLTISGGGALIVEANYHDAITSKDDLTIAGGDITVTSVNDGIRGRDALTITGGRIVVNAAGDGLESNNDEEAGKGVIVIENAALDITAGEDGVEAESSVAVRSGQIVLTTGGGSANASAQGKGWGAWGPGGRGRAPTAAPAADEPSAKGIKAGALLTVEGGTIRIDSSDDALHSNGRLAIAGGDIAIASGDDGAHADAEIVLSGGRIAISRSYEGVESAVIRILGGELRVVSSDDGLNVAGGVDASALGGRPGQNTFAPTSDQRLEISGGYIAVDAAGDGFDINGAVAMSGGVAIIHGPTSDGNGALDYDRGFKMTGGYLLAVGSAGMAQAPDASSTQRAMMVNFEAAQPAGAPLHIQGADGAALVTFIPLRAYRSVVFSSPELAAGATYHVYTGGAAEGEGRDGLYEANAYTPGQRLASATLTDIITRVGPGGMMRGPGGGGRR